MMKRRSDLSKMMRDRRQEALERLHERRHEALRALHDWTHEMEPEILAHSSGPMQGVRREWLYMLGGVALGLLAMYWLDPNQGNRRRALLRDQFVHYQHVAGDTLEGRARDVRNRSQGVAAKARRLVRADQDGDREPAGVGSESPDVDQREMPGY